MADTTWIDISVPLHSGMVHWPGDPEVRFERTQEIARGNSANLSQLSMGSHTGTHIDAPLHFIPGGQSIAEMPLEAAVGPARVIEIKDAESIRLEELEPHRIRRGERILFKTRNSPRAWQTRGFVEDYVFISKEAAEYLAQRRVKLVGVDYLSVGAYKRDGPETHRTLLGGGVWVIEGLDLTGVSPGRYQLICLPLRIENGDGAPARAILRPVAR